MHRYTSGSSRYLQRERNVCARSLGGPGGGGGGTSFINARPKASMDGPVNERDSIPRTPPLPPLVLACSFSFLSFPRRLAAAIYSHSAPPPSPPRSGLIIRADCIENAPDRNFTAQVLRSYDVFGKEISLSLFLAGFRLPRQVSTLKVVEGLPKTDICPL